jgi:hypothetical protein
MPPHSLPAHSRHWPVTKSQQRRHQSAEILAGAGEEGHTGVRSCGVAGKWGEAFAFCIEQRLGAGAIEGLPNSIPPVKDPAPSNTHHAVTTPILWECSLLR